MKKLLFLLFAVLLLGSCASSRRMMRVSPFADRNDVLNPNPQRTNLFPLFYKNGNVNSALWPLIDWDRQGFAFRPLYNLEGNDQSILFPLSGWNAKDGDGWVTTMYWDDGIFGMFPLFRYEEDDWSHYGPFWTSDDSTGFFPLLMYSKKGLSYYGPFWHRNRDLSTGDFGVTATEAGLFPLFGKWHDGWHFLNLIKDEDSTWFFPLVYHEKGKRLWLAELYNWEKSGNIKEHRFISWLSQFRYKTHGRYTDEERDELTSSYAFPLWYYDNDKSGSTFVSPLSYRYSSDQKKRFHIFPLWYSSEKGEDNFSMLLPLYAKVGNDKAWFIATLLGAAGKDDRDKSKWLVTPIFGYGSSEDESFAFKNLLGPLYIDYKNKDKKFTSYLWPLYAQSENADEESYHALAYLFNRTVSEHGATTLIFPLTWHSTQDTGNKQRSENYSLLGLYHHFNEETKNKKSSANRIWPLYSYTKNTYEPDIFYDTLLTLMNIESNSKRFDFELLSGLLYGYERNGPADNPSSTDSGNLLFSYGTFNNIRKKLHYSYKDSYDVHSGYDWRFLFYNYDSNNLVYLDEDLLTKKEQKALREFDLDRHTDDIRIKAPQLHKSKKTGRSNHRYGKQQGSHLCKNCSETAAVLNSKGYKCAYNYASITTAYQKFLKDNLKQAEGSRHYIPLLFEKESTPKASEWELLWGLSRYKSEEDRHHFSVLKFLYKEDGKGDNVARDIFPFIQVDSGEKSGFSFLGHHSLGFLFNWKHDKDKGHHGHILFIPWG